MPGPVGVALAGLAAKTWAEMWKLYNERYGRWGEETVRRLQREVEEAKADLASEGKMLIAIGKRLAESQHRSEYRLKQWLASDERANELAARLNEAMCRIAFLENPTAPASPFDDEPGVPEPTERTDP
jgi:seryl-tRNA synthetase